MLGSLSASLLSADRYKRLRSIALSICISTALWSSSTIIAFSLRYEENFGAHLHEILIYGGLGLVIKIALVLGGGLWRGVRGQAGLHDIMRAAGAIALGVVLHAALVLALGAAGVNVPPSIPVIEGLLALVLLSGRSVVERLRTERLPARRAAHDATKRVLIAGAGDAGRLIAREMRRHPEDHLVPVAFLDDDPDKIGQHLLGLPVLGALDDLPQAAARVRADLVLIALPSAGGDAVRRVVQIARDMELPYQTMPALQDIIGGRVSIKELRDVKVEDVLRRKPTQLDDAGISAYLEGRTVLVTGAGGSIGSEIVRQVARYRPGHIILFGRGENSIFEIQQEVASRFPGVQHTAIIGDVRHASHLRSVFERFMPDVVVHAAAHKHVPLMEDSPSEAVYNNVLGTRSVAELCLAFGVSRFVNISTDKAVNPTSVMGSSKRLAEMIVSAAAARAQPHQAFMSVRFGNVLGSRGSVIPTFLRQIREGGPVTVTHPDMVRYFMTIPEASRLVLQAAALGHNGAVHVLNMGAPVRILDLAQDVIALSGARDIDIVFTGIRPGEKLFEELLTSGENVSVTEHEDIFIAHPEQPDEVWLRDQLRTLEAHARDEDYRTVRALLRDMIPESLLKV